MPAGDSPACKGERKREEERGRERVLVAAHEERAEGERKWENNISACDVVVLGFTK